MQGGAYTPAQTFDEPHVGLDEDDGPSAPASPPGTPGSTARRDLVPPPPFPPFSAPDHRTLLRNTVCLTEVRKVLSFFLTGPEMPFFQNRLLPPRHKVRFTGVSLRGTFRPSCRTRQARAVPRQAGCAACTE